MRTSALFGVKNFGFSKIYGVSAQTRGRGVEPVRTFCGQGGVNFFVILCRHLLWMPLS